MNLYYKLSILMGLVVVISNYLVQFPIEKFGLSEIFNSIVDKIKNLFNRLKDKMGSFMGLLSGIGIPEMTLYEGGKFLNPIKIGPWFPFKDDEKKESSADATVNSEGGKKLDKIDKEAEKSGGTFDFLSNMNPFSWGSSDKDDEKTEIINSMKQSVEKEIARGNLREANQFLKAMADDLPPKEFQTLQSKILEAHRNKKFQESAQTSPTMLKQYSFSESDSKEIQNKLKFSSPVSGSSTNVSSVSSNTNISSTTRTEKTKMFGN